MFVETRERIEGREIGTGKTPQVWGRTVQSVQVTTWQGENQLKQRDQDEEEWGRESTRGTRPDEATRVGENAATFPYHELTATNQVTSPCTEKDGEQKGLEGRNWLRSAAYRKEFLEKIKKIHEEIVGLPVSTEEEEETLPKEFLQEIWVDPGLVDHADYEVIETEGHDVSTQKAVDREEGGFKSEGPTFQPSILPNPREPVIRLAERMSEGRGEPPPTSPRPPDRKIPSQACNLPAKCTVPVIVLDEEGNSLHVENVDVARAFFMATKKRGGPTLALEVENERVIGFLDSDATQNFISESLAHELRLQIDPTGVRPVYLALYGVEAMTLGWCRFIAKLPNQALMIEAWVMRDLQRPLILGDNFLIEHGVVMSYEEQYITVGREKQMNFSWGPRTVGNGGSHSKLPEDLQIGLTGEDRLKIEAVLKRHAKLFSKKIGQTKTLQHEIKLTSDKVIRKHPYSYSRDKWEAIIKQVREIEAEGYVQPSHSAYSFCIVLVKKKDGTLRFCVDYIDLNLVTESDAYPIPSIDDILRVFDKSTIFSIIDLKKGYWQVLLAEESRRYTAFQTPIGLFEWRVMPMGLKNSPITFQRVMDDSLRGLVGDCVVVYLDDVVVYSQTVDQHCEHLNKVLQRLHNAGFTVNADKCQFGVSKMDCLGHVVSEEGVGPQLEKLVHIAEYPRPTKVKEVRKFLGTTGWYMSYVENYASIVAPLTDLTQTVIKFRWTEREENAFLLIKQKLAEAKVLSHPDYEKVFYLQTDACKIGLGAILYQLSDEGEKRIVRYGSCKTKTHQKSYHATELELLAVMWAVRKFRVFLGKPFILRTDSQALKWMHSLRDHCSKLMRWSLELADLDFAMEHVAGKENEGPDGLSRYPVGEEDPELADRAEELCPPASLETGESPEFLMSIATLPRAEVADRLPQDIQDKYKKKMI